MNDDDPITGTLTKLGGQRYSGTSRYSNVPE